MIASCKCIYCRENIEFDLADFESHGETASERIGQKIPCPHCGQQTILGIVKKSAGFSNNPKPTDARTATMQKSDSIGGGVIVQIIGVLFCLTLVGALLGVPLIIWGGKIARKKRCSECGTTLASSSVKICPACKSFF